MTKTALTLLILLSPATVLASDLLPGGKGAIAVGFRQFTLGEQYYDHTGTMKPIGNKFNTEFSAKRMSSGELGTDFKRLYDELKKFDSAKTGNKSLADQMDFGRLTGDVETRTSAQYLAVAYGWTDSLNIYGAIPLVRCAVDSNLRYEGNNNAAAVKARVGNLAFKEIQDGLHKASTMSAYQIKQQIENDYGYEPIDHWEYSGLGDIVLGAKGRLLNESLGFSRYKLILSNQLELPTGHADDPDSLTDAPLSKGYISNMISAAQSLEFNLVTFGIDAGVGLGLPTETKRRVPVADESLVSKDRKVTVQWTPGLDTKTIGSVSTGPNYLKASYRLGMTEHFQDRYQGSLQGNYAALEKESAFKETFHEVALQISTVDAFLSGSFAIPLIVTLTGRETMSARNEYRKKYVELSVASFFQTESSSSRRVEQTDPYPKYAQARPSNR